MLCSHWPEEFHKGKRFLKTLTTSSTPGYAMKCQDRGKCAGAIVGKAMEVFDGGSGYYGKIIALVVLG